MSAHALTGPQLRAYLRRLGYAGSLEPVATNLVALHTAHMLAVPFENLDIHLGRRIVLEEQSLFDKIVTSRRGGFCYELNGLFASLLQTLGFHVSLHSARVMFGDGNLTPEFDHLVLSVRLEDLWLADVGFGDSFVEPLRFAISDDQTQGGRKFRLVSDGERWVMSERGTDDANGYSFSLHPHELADFVPRCDWHQTSRESHFRRGPICSLATPTGRISLTSERFIETRNGGRRERELAGESEFDDILASRFGVVHSGPARQPGLP